MKPIHFSIILAIALLPATHASAGDDRDAFFDRQVMVRLAPGFDIEDFNTAHETTTIESIASRNIHLLELPEGVEDEELWLDELLADPPPGLVWAELNYVGEDGEGRTGSFFVSGLRSRDLYQNQWLINRINLPRAHQQSTGQDIIVAVLDTGIDATHPVLLPRVLPNGFNFVDGTDNTLDLPDGLDNDGDGVFDESVGHGTFMAGLIALVAPDAELLPVVVLNSDGHGTGFHFAAGLFYAIDEGADVVNMSLGTTYDSQALKDALIEARMRGVIVVAAAGNIPGADSMFLPDPENPEDPEEHPATVDGVIGVASTNSDNFKAVFSKYHHKLAMAVPGTSIHSTIPRTAEGHTFAEWEGTSTSTAIASGAAALVAAAHPDWPVQTRAAAVNEAIEDSAVRLPRDPFFDAGNLGKGLLDADAAIRELPSVMMLADAEISFGTHLRGSVTSLLDEADDEDINSYLTGRSGFGFTADASNRLDLALGFFTNDQNPTEFQIDIVDRIDTPGARGVIQLRDWNTGLLVDVGSYNVSLQDELHRFVVPTPARFVRGSDGRVEMVVKHTVVVTFASGFISFFDSVDMDVED